MFVILITAFIFGIAMYLIGSIGLALKGGGSTPRHPDDHSLWGPPRPPEVEPYERTFWGPYR